MFTDIHQICPGRSLSDDNTYSTEVLRAAATDESALNALLALSASYRRELEPGQPQYAVAESHSMSKAVRCLRNNLGSFFNSSGWPSRRNCLVTLMLLTHYYVVKPGELSWSVHVNAARNLIDGEPNYELVDFSSLRVIAFHEILAKTVCPLHHGLLPLVGFLSLFAICR